MARAPGDNNYSPREKKILADNAALKAEIAGLKARHKAEIEAKKQRIRELRDRV